MPDDPGIPFEKLAPPPAPPAPAPADPAPSKVFGKFDSIEAAEKGYWEQQTTIKAREEELARERAARVQYEQMLSATRQPEKVDDPLAELDALGVPKNSFLAAVKAVVQQELGPVARGMQAAAVFEQQHPEYTPVRGDVAKFIQGDPNLAGRFAAMYQTDEYGAMEWALDRFKETKRAITPASAADDPAKGALPSGGATPPGEADEEATNKKLREDVAAAKAYYEKYGDSAPLAAALARAGLKPRFR